MKKYCQMDKASKLMTAMSAIALILLSGCKPPQNFDSISGIEPLNVSHVREISAGAYMTMLLYDDAVYVWGRNDQESPLGIGNTDLSQVTVPTRIPDLQNVVDIATGSGHCLALKADGTVWGWGWNGYGQAGIGSATVDGISAPEQVSLLDDVIAISASGATSMALKRDGTIWIWGDLYWFGSVDEARRWGAAEAQLDVWDQTVIYTAVPYHVATVEDAWKISTSGTHFLALTTDGTIVAWGTNEHGELGLDVSAFERVLSPRQIIERSDFVDVVARGGGGLALDNDGYVWVWGLNEDFLLGIKGTDPIVSPTKIRHLQNVQAISGLTHNLALIDDGTVWAWGINHRGQLGIGTTDDISTPVQIPDLSNIVMIEAGVTTSFALDQDGYLWAWGENDFGQLGNDTLDNSLAPIQVHWLEGDQK